MEKIDEIIRLHKKLTLDEMEDLINREEAFENAWPQPRQPLTKKMHKLIKLTNSLSEEENEILAARLSKVPKFLLTHYRQLLTKKFLKKLLAVLFGILVNIVLYAGIFLLTMYVYGWLERFYRWLDR